MDQLDIDLYNSIIWPAIDAEPYPGHIRMDCALKRGQTCAD